MIASGPPNFIRVVCWEIFFLTFETSFDLKKNSQNVGPTAFATV